MKPQEEKHLEDWYNNHFKKDQQLEWSELNENQKRMLYNTIEYTTYNASQALSRFGHAASEAAKKVWSKENRNKK